MKTALLVVGHGSKSKDAVAVFNRIIEEIRGKSSFDFVEGAHMELSSPGINETVDNLVSKGASTIIIGPYFLYEGMHIKRDIPDIISGMSKKYPDIIFTLAKPIGFEPVLADIILKRAQDAIQQ
jgi:sirohydrochlorin ferrochelatase